MVPWAARAGALAAVEGGDPSLCSALGSVTNGVLLQGFGLAAI